ncbi:MAG TPA: DEAD/DEAH box helicase [Candidatus Nanoarchaeia archaeon]|nr:DEAD/DEAH box helicase [Candidatus Nanoarchaeia archaeon]
MNLKEIKLQPELEKAILDLGFSEFTEIQEKCIPAIQAGKDIIGVSHTGSGKTAAFGFPSLEKVTQGKGIQLLVLVPTRELCNQVAKEFHKFTKYKKLLTVEVYGGVSINPQIDGLRRADVVVGTPGRVLDHLERRTIDFSKVKVLVLDEADKMFEMGFIDDVKDIISKVNKDRQTLLFSATMSQEVQDITRNYMKAPEKIKMQTYVDKSKLIQHYYDVDSRDKFAMAVHVLKKELSGLALVFCATRHMTDSLARNLNKQGIKAQPLHGGLTQNRRQAVLEDFHKGRLDVLVASDVAARGLDIKNVGLVLNYDLPKTSQDYVHRIGRTARAGSDGKVVSLLAPQDHDNFRRVLEDRALMVHKEKLPEFEKVEFTRGESRGRSFGGGRGGFGGGRSTGGGRSGFGGRSEGRPAYGGNREDRYSRSSGSGDRPRFGSSRGGFGRNNRSDDRRGGSSFEDK